MEYIYKNHVEIVDNVIPESQLVRELPHQSWDETLKKEARVLFTNVMYYNTVSKLFYLSKKIGEDAAADYYRNLADQLKAEINELFWDEELGHYIDWIDDDGKRFISYSTPGNAMAILSGIADKKQTLSIHQHMKNNGIYEGPPLTTNFPQYPESQVFLWERELKGLPNYHNGNHWLWIGCLDAVAKYRAGKEYNEQELIIYAKKELEDIAKLINYHGTVHEIFASDGKPLVSTRNNFDMPKYITNRKARLVGFGFRTLQKVRALFNKETRIKVFQSETKFSWSAGMYIWAVNEIYSGSVKNSD